MASRAEFRVSIGVSERIRAALRVFWARAVKSMAAVMAVYGINNAELQS